MEDAFNALGPNKPFLASASSVDPKWAWRAVFVTPYLGAELALEECIYNDDLNTILDNYQIESLIVDGVEYVPTPQAPVNNLISIGIYTWNTRLADFINSLNLNSFYAVYPTESDMDAVDAIEYGAQDAKPRNCIRLVTEIGVDFTLIASTAAAGWHKITKTTSEWGVDGVSWTITAGDEFYLFNRFGCANL